MNLSYASYSPNQAVSEYQARLAAQRVADEVSQSAAGPGMMASYVLADRVPDWNHLRHLGTKGLHMYSAGHLKAGLLALADPDLFAVNTTTYPFTRTQQLERFAAELATR